MSRGPSVENQLIERANALRTDGHIYTAELLYKAVDKIRKLTRERDEAKEAYSILKREMGGVIRERDEALRVVNAKQERIERLHDTLDDRGVASGRIEDRVLTLTRERESRDALLEALEEARLALEPYDDIKPRDWRTDRENLRRAHQTILAALAKAKGVE